MCPSLPALIYLLLLAAVGAAHAQSEPGTAPDPAARDQLVWINQPGSARPLLTRLCRPPGDAPAPIMVFSHGRGTQAERSREKPLSCRSEAARWFLARGWMIIAPLRLGYGETGGVDVEAQSCTVRRDYLAAADIAARAIDAAIVFAEAQPFARHDRVLLVGQSAGGLATLAYAAHPRPEVAAVVNMAGGNGGHMQNFPNTNCFPELLAAAAGRAGRTSPVPELWIYTANDSFFAPPIAAAMHAAFTQAGGTAELHQLGPFGDDGHHLFLGRGGSQIWGPIVADYLARRGMLAGAATAGVQLSGKTVPP